MNRGVTESTVEEAALAWLEAGGWLVAHGPAIGPAQPPAKWAGRGERVLAARIIGRAG